MKKPYRYSEPRYHTTTEGMGDNEQETDMDKINLTEKLASFHSHWDPKIVAELNGQHVKLAKFKGDFVWHRHEDQDELFLVLDGSFDLLLRDRAITLRAGELVVVPRGVEHCPRAEEEVQVLIFEPAGTLNTGDANTSTHTVPSPERI